MSDGYPIPAAFENLRLEAPLKTNFHHFSSSASPSSALQTKNNKMVLSDKNITNFYENIGRLDNPEQRLVNKKLVGEKNLANNKQKQCERDATAVEEGEVTASQENEWKVGNLNYGSMCLNNPFRENPVEYIGNEEEKRRSVEEGGGYSMRLPCDDNRNRKDGYLGINWNAGTPAANDRSVVDINENFTEPVIHHKLNMSYHVEHRTAALKNHNGCFSGEGTRSISEDEKREPLPMHCKPKRPQSIMCGKNKKGLITEPVFSMDKQAFGFNHRDQYKCFNSNARTSSANGRILDANVTSMGFSVFKVGLESGDLLSGSVVDSQRPAPRPVATTNAPLVPHRRSQSTPRPSQHTATSSVVVNSTTSSGSNELAHSELKEKSEKRPKSLDRGVTYLENVTVQRSVNFNLMQSTMYKQSGSPQQSMKNSASFHGQCYLSTESSMIGSDMNGSYGNRGRMLPEGIRRANRPLSYTYGSTGSEQAFLENQLRIYSEQLKTITESVRMYSEKAKLLSELKRQELLSNKKPSTGFTMPTSKSDSKLNDISFHHHQQQPHPETSNVNAALNQNHKQTSSHQLRLFLEDIRSNIRESTPLMTTQPIDTTGDVPITRNLEEKNEAVPKKLMGQQPPPIPQRKRQQPIVNSGSLIEPESKPDINTTGSHHLNNNSSNSCTTKMLRGIELDFNQILDNFNCATKQQFGSGNRGDYLEDYLTAMRRTSNEIRQAALNMKQSGLVQEGSSSSSSNNVGWCGGGTSSDDNSSTSTTPGSIREAVQNLLAMPRNGVQVMDDRMRLFIDILDTQDKFSQVYINAYVCLYS